MARKSAKSDPNGIKIARQKHRIDHGALEYYILISLVEIGFLIEHRQKALVYRASGGPEIKYFPDP